MPLVPAAESVWHAPQPLEAKRRFPAAGVARQLERRKVGVATAGRLLGDRPLDRLRRRRDLAVVAPARQERERREQERECGERSAHRAESIQAARRLAREWSPRTAGR